MTDKRRRLDKLGAGRLDPELARLTDAQLLRLFAREHSGEAALERARTERRRVNPLFAHMDDLTDVELLAEYEAAVAEVQALEAEGRARTATPEPGAAPEPELLPVPPIEPNPIALQALPTPRGDPPGAHVSYALKDCSCFQCGAHRAAEQQEAEQRALEVKAEGDPMEPGSVRVGPTATPAFRWAVGERYDP